MDPGACGTRAGIPDRRRAEQFRLDGAPRRRVSRRTAPYFVIEADEYDTAFFDKRAKFVHYRPRTLILNNLEYDHADIYPDVAAIRRQFNQLLRTVPAAGRIVLNGEDARARGHAGGRAAGRRAKHSACRRADAEWSAALAPESAWRRVHRAARGAEPLRGCAGSLLGEHNVMNALGGDRGGQSRRACRPSAPLEALSEFRGVKRRMEIRGVAGGVTVYDDFAHHPTAIETTLKGLRARLPDARIIAVLEPRSNTMKLGVHRDQLAPALAAADRAWFLNVAGARLGPARGGRAAWSARASFASTVDALVQGLGRRQPARRSCAGDEQRRLRRPA